jgi:hypothetical protein
MYLISWEEGAIRLEGSLAITSSNKGSPWDPKRNEMLLKKLRDP